MQKGLTFTPYVASIIPYLVSYIPYLINYNYNSMKRVKVRLYNYPEMVKVQTIFIPLRQSPPQARSYFRLFLSDLRQPIIATYVRVRIIDIGQR